MMVSHFARLPSPQTHPTLVEVVTKVPTRLWKLFERHPCSLQINRSVQAPSSRQKVLDADSATYPTSRRLRPPSSTMDRLDTEDGQLFIKVCAGRPVTGIVDFEIIAAMSAPPLHEEMTPCRVTIVADIFIYFRVWPRSSANTKKHLPTASNCP
jgi:hypothetical protein